MGCGGSKSKKGKKKKKSVDDKLAAAAKLAERNMKLLLLGAGEAGKSTFVKQVKLIHLGEISSDEKAVYTKGVKKNVIECMQVVVKAARSLGCDGENEELTAHANFVLGLDAPNADFTPEISNAIAALWASPWIKAAYEQRHTFWHLDASGYYFDNVKRFSEPGYSASTTDIIKARVLTTGIQITEFVEKKYQFQVVDVGGQRSERRKWINCFDNVQGIMFLVNLQGYDMVLFEDEGVNRMTESVNLFREVAKNQLFFNTPIFLMCTKVDLFGESIMKKDLSTVFPEYTGGCDKDAALAHIQQKYKDIIKEYVPNKELKCFAFNNSEKESTDGVFTQVRAAVVEANKPSA